MPAHARVKLIVINAFIARCMWVISACSLSVEAFGEEAAAPSPGPRETAIRFYIAISEGNIDQAMSAVDSRFEGRDELEKLGLLFRDLNHAKSSFTKSAESQFGHIGRIVADDQLADGTLAFEVTEAYTNVDGPAAVTVKASRYDVSALTAISMGKLTADGNSAVLEAMGLGVFNLTRVEGQWKISQLMFSRQLVERIGLEVRAVPIAEDLLAKNGNKSIVAISTLLTAARLMVVTGKSDK